MEIEFSSYQMFISIFFLFLILLKIIIASKSKRSDTNLPPGLRKLPLIGNMHLLVGSQPHHVLRDLAIKYGPIMHLKFGEIPTIVISSPEYAKEVMKTHDITFATRPEIQAAKVMSYNCTDIAFAPYGEYWRQLRKICISELLTTKRVQSFRSIREEEFNNLAKWISSNEGKPINLTEKVYSCTFNIISRIALGVKIEEQNTLLSAIKEVITLATGFDIADVYPSIKLLQMVNPTKFTIKKKHKQIDIILEKIINDHIVRSAEKGLDVPLTTDNIKAIILDVFTAGSETSATTVIWAMAEMLKHPDVRKRAQNEVRKNYNDKGYIDETNLQELEYLKLVIKETLRLHPPLPLLIPREAREKCKINGYDIPMNTRILVNTWAIGRDPKIWENAEMFDPQRFLGSSVDFKGNYFEYIPFGAGRRICPRISFGLANVELPLATLLYHFDWSLPNGMKPEELVMVETFGATVRRKQALEAIPFVKIPCTVQ